MNIFVTNYYILMNFYSLRGKILLIYVQKYYGPIIIQNSIKAIFSKEKMYKIIIKDN